MKRVMVAWLFAFSLLIGFLSLGIALVIFFEPIYHVSIDWFNIEKMTGLTRTMLIEEYHGLIQYLTRPWVEPLQLIYFSSSESGIFHFYEVKQLFLLNFGICIVANGLNIGLFLYVKAKKYMRELVQPLKCMLFAPIAIIGAIVLFFEQLFILFHEVFFNNDAWIFDPTTDPIINALPQDFFMLCFAFVFIFLFGALWGSFVYVRKQRNIEKSI